LETELEVRSATPDDQSWVGKLFEANASVLGNMSGGTMFWRWQNAGSKNERLLVAGKLGFAHYRIRKDGTRVLYEIAVDASAKRRGVGRTLMDRIGRPVTLKTDAGHAESNAFYKSIGLTNCGTTVARSGKRLNVWQGW
jgi:ribosomal protein S18 acetylase RimI-like enzyme